MAQPACAVDVPELRLVGEVGQLSACHFAQDLATADSPSELVEEIVEHAPPKAVLAEEAAAAVAELRPKTRVSALAIVTFVLGVATPVLALLLSDQDVSLRGGLVMLLGGATVLIGRRALLAIEAGKGYVLGRMPARFGYGLAWTTLAIWGIYCMLWLFANLLPGASPSTRSTPSRWRPPQRRTAPSSRSAIS